MKKLFSLIRGALIFVFWTSLFIFLSNRLIDIVWHFNFMSVHSWNVLSAFWNNGGVIKTTSDILLIVSLCLLPVLWLTGFIFMLRLNYVNLLISLLTPFRFFGRGKSVEPERIIIKNIKSSQQMIEDIKTEIESLKPSQSKEAGNIRSEITQKLSKEVKK